MAETKGTDQVIEPSLPPVTPEEGQTDNPATLELEKLKKDYESKLAIEKAQAAGSTRAFNEMKKQLEEIQKTSMSDKERAEYDRKKAEADRLDFENQKRELERSKIKFKFMVENKIDSRLERYLTAETEDGLKGDVEALNQYVEEKIKPFRDELEKFKADISRPGGGSINAPADAKSKMLEAEAKFQAAVKSGDTLAQRAAADEAFYWKEQALKIK